MNFQQLRIVRETVRQHFNLTTVAHTLFTSQPGVSKHIKDLEDELGIEIFVRRGKRLIGLTEPGSEFLVLVERILHDAQNASMIAEHFANANRGNLVVATTHSQARYVLPSLVKRFKADYPHVRLALHQASPHEIADLLLAGEADIAIASDGLANIPDFVSFPYYTWNHVVVTPRAHPLTQLTTLQLNNLADYPIVTYHTGFAGRKSIDEAFARLGLVPDIVLTALDDDVIKTYVDIGLGIGIIAETSYQSERDTHLVCLPVPKLFSPKITHLALRRGAYLRSYAYAFIQQLIPALSATHIAEALREAPPLLNSIDDFSI